MNIKPRDTLRSATIEKLLSVFPGAQLVKTSTNGSGIGYVSDVIDEETGAPYVVVIGVTVPLTAETKRSKAFDFDAAVEAAKNAPGRRVADPEKKAAAESKHSEAVARRTRNMEALTKWAQEGGLGAGMIPSQVWDHKDEIGLDVATPMMVGSVLKELAATGVLVAGKDEKKRNLYTVA